MEALSGQGGAASIAPRADAPSWHVAPLSGWLNDPNGPLYYNGAYHMFFQHLPGSAAWGFNLVWGHAASKDLVHWELLPNAIEPSPGTVDGDGCFSGCAVIDEDGTPALLYTGVRLRGSLFAGPLPPEEYDLGLPFIESQCVVYAEDHKGDWRLPYWRKHAVPFLSLPPPDLKLAGWRDPYIVGPPQGHPEQGWTMLIGSGIKEQGGTVLQYRSRHLKQGWELVGELCSGKEDDGTGIVWECPLLVQLPTLPGTSLSPATSSGLSSNSARASSSSSGGGIDSDGHEPNQQAKLPNGDATTAGTAGSTQPVSVGLNGRKYFFCISPDACTNPTLYYLGDYQEADFPAAGVKLEAGSLAAAIETASTTRPEGPAIAGTPGTRQGKFLVSQALGPFRLDLGDVLYAPNTLMDPDKGRVLLWAWMQEARKVAGNYMYAGCLSCARELWLEYGSDPDQPRLVQRPVHELSGLRRTKGAWLWPPRQQQQADAFIPASNTTSTNTGLTGLSTKLASSQFAAASAQHPAAAVQGSGAERLPSSGSVRHLQVEARHGSGVAGSVLSYQGSLHEADDHGVSEQAQALEVAGASQSSTGSGRRCKKPPSQRKGSINLKAQASPFASMGVQSSIDDDDLPVFQSTRVASFTFTRPANMGSEPPKEQPAEQPAEVVVVCEAPPPEQQPMGGAQQDSLLVGPGQSYRIPYIGGACLDLDLQLALVLPEEAEEVAAEAAGQPALQPAGLSRRSTGGPPASQQAVPASEPEWTAGMGRSGDQGAKAAAPIPEGACSGLVLRSWQAGVEGAAAILYCWATQYLEVVFEALDPETHEFSLASPNCRRVGGKLQCPPAPGQPLSLRVLIDYSLVEVFTGGGEVLSTRVYRGVPPPEEGCGIDLVSLGCATQVVSAGAYEMENCWVSSGPLPIQVKARDELAAQLATLQLPSAVGGLVGMSPVTSTPASRAISRAASLLLGRMSDTGSVSMLSRRSSRAGDTTPPPEPDTDVLPMTVPPVTHVTLTRLTPSITPAILSPRASHFGGLHSVFGGSPNHGQFGSLAGTPPHFGNSTFLGTSPAQPGFLMPDPRPGTSSAVHPGTTMAAPTSTQFGFHEIGSPNATTHVLQSAITKLSAVGQGVPVTYLPPRNSSTMFSMISSGRVSRAASMADELGSMKFRADGSPMEGPDGGVSSGSLPRGSPYDKSFLEQRGSQPQVVMGM